MKTLLFSLTTIIGLTSVSSNPTKVEGVEGSVKFINFDSTYTNSYVLSVLSSYKRSERFYKLDSKKNVVLTKDFYKVSKIFLNRDNDVYVFDYDENESDITIWILHSNTNTFRKISMFSLPILEKINAFKDNEDNIFFNTKEGTAILKPRQNIVLGIQNLPERGYFDYVVNKNDVYMAFYTRRYPESVKMVINSTAKNQYVPYGDAIQQPEDGSTNWTSNSLRLPPHAQYLFADKMHVGKFGTYSISTLSKTRTHFTRVDEPTRRLLLLEYGTTYKILCETDQRLFLISEKDKFFNIYFISKDNEVLALKEIFSSGLVNSTQCATGSVPPSAFISVEKSVILVKNKEREGIKIDVPSDEDIVSILVDKYDDLWVFTKDLYVIKNNNQKPTKLYSLSDIDSISATKENRLTNEVFVASKNGLFVCKK